MKKTVLFTLAFLATISFARAQSNTFTFTGDGSSATTEQFLFGSDAGVYALSAGASFSESGAFISYNAEVVSGSPISETMGFATTAGNSVNATLEYRVRKRGVNSATVTILVGANSQTYVLPVTAETGLADHLLTFNTVIPLSSTATTVTIRIDEMSTTASNIRFRIHHVDVIGQMTLSTNDFETEETSVKVFPNPVSNSFQIDSNNTIERVELYNITGQLLKTFSQEANYDISDLATGIYIANIKTLSGSKTMKILKK